MPDTKKFFSSLGQRVKKLRKDRGYSQEDMISFGFSARHWQQIEAGRPITVTTALKICDAFHISIAQLVTGLDHGIYRQSETAATENRSLELPRDAKRLR